jgi:hypothetical protein
MLPSVRRKLKWRSNKPISKGAEVMNRARILKRIKELQMKKGRDCLGHQFYLRSKTVETKHGEDKTVFAKGQEDAKLKWEKELKRSSMEFRLFVAFVRELLYAIHRTSPPWFMGREGRKPLDPYFLNLFERGLPHLNSGHRKGLFASPKSKAHDKVCLRFESLAEQWEKWAD